MYDSHLEEHLLLGHLEGHLLLDGNIVVGALLFEVALLKQGSRWIRS